ncbi:MAG: AEC family transporter [Hungatella sp.]|jgi:predicted permease|nr:AEC family transporter [Hungatella sp.]
MDVTVILNQMAQLVLVMAAGYGLYKQGQIDDVFYSRLNKFVLHVTMPAMILGSVLTQSRSVQIHMPSMAASCLILTAVLPVLSFLTAKLLPVAKEDKGLYAFMMMYPNVGFMGFPIMKSIFGNDSVLATSVINLCFNISLFTIGPAAMGKQNSEKNVFSLKTFLSPGIIASVCAVIFYGFSIPCPFAAGNALNLIGSMTTPLAMMLIGVILAKIPFMEVWKDARTYWFSLLIQLVIPTAAWPLLKQLIADPLIRGITLIILAMPVANSAVIFSQEYEKDEMLAAKMVFMSTLISIVTIPLVAVWFLIP